MTGAKLIASTGCARLFHVLFLSRHSQTSCDVQLFSKKKKLNKTGRTHVALRSLKDLDVAGTVLLTCAADITALLGACSASLSKQRSADAVARRRSKKEAKKEAKKKQREQHPDKYALQAKYAIRGKYSERVQKKTFVGNPKNPKNPLSPLKPLKEGGQSRAASVTHPKPPRGWLMCGRMGQPVDRSHLIPCKVVKTSVVMIQ